MADGVEVEPKVANQPFPVEDYEVMNTAPIGDSKVPGSLGMANHEATRQNGYHTPVDQEDYEEPQQNQADEDYEITVDQRTAPVEEDSYEVTDTAAGETYEGGNVWFQRIFTFPMKGPGNSSGERRESEDLRFYKEKYEAMVEFPVGGGVGLQTKKQPSMVEAWTFFETWKLQRFAIYHLKHQKRSHKCWELHSFFFYGSCITKHLMCGLSGNCWLSFPLQQLRETSRLKLHEQFPYVNPLTPREKH